MNEANLFFPSVKPWLYWSIFPIHRVFLGLYFEQIFLAGTEHPTPNFRADVFINIAAPLYSKDYRQENDKKTAIALTEALQTSLVQALQT